MMRIQDILIFKMKNAFVSTYVRFVSDSSSSFDEYLNARRDVPSTYHIPLRFGGYPLFVPSDPAVQEALEELKKVTDHLKNALSDLPPIASRELLRSCIVEEIIQTNEMEGVFSTRKDVYRIIDDIRVVKKNKVQSIANKYYLLLHRAPDKVLSLQDIRLQYDQLLKDALDEKDAPDGELFRKGPVSVTDGVKTIHNGLFPENRIHEALQCFLEISNGTMLTPFERLLVGHYIFEYAHPFYDGNGRCGRYLMTLFALKDLPEIAAFRLATAIGKRKQRYYKAFERTQDVRNRSDLSTFIYPLLEILLEEYEYLLDDIASKKEKSKALRSAIIASGESLEDNPVLQVLADATAYASFGVRVEEIVSSTSLSLATVNRQLKALTSKGWIIKEKNGYQSYFRLNIDAIS